LIEIFIESIKSGPPQASSISRLNYTETRLLLYTGNKKDPFVVEIGDPKCCYSALRKSEMPNIGTSVVRDADFRYFGVSENRNADLGQQQEYTKKN